MNSYAASASRIQTVRIAPPTVAPPVVAPPVVTPDRTPPATRIRRVATNKQPITLRGTATDVGSIRRVRVWVARHVSNKLCRFLRADRKFSKAGFCDETIYLNAKGTSSWSLKLPSLAPGRYTIWTRGIDAAGNIELKDRGRNLLYVRIPVPRR